jgi:DNA-binding SARP family transcriptional activator
MGTTIRLAGLTIAVVPADGVPCYLEPGQTQIALAWLLLERDRGTTRDGLADVVWPDQLPRTWGSALRSLVSRLRAFLATTLALPSSAHPVVAQGGRYLVRLPDDVVIDVEAAARSVAAAQGALAAGDAATAARLATEGADCLRCPFLPAHDGPWVAAKRDHLSELLLAALETASQAALELRDPTRALMLAEEAAKLAPLRESAHRCRMAAHAASGNRGQALRAYQDIRRLLAEELGVDPAPDTEAAYLELLGVPSSSSSSSSSPSPSPMAATALEAGAHGQAPASRRRVAPFVDRTGQMGVISEAWGRAAQARRQLLYITGEAGVGKTRLMKEAGHRVAVDGGLVLFGRCDRDSPIAYQPFVEALDGYVAAIPADELSTLSRLAQRELAALFPAADGQQAGPGSGPGPGSGSGSGSGPGSDNLADVFGAVTELVAITSRRRPMLLLFDDLHWANRDTLVFLRHLLRHTDESRLLVIATARDDLEHGRSLAEVTYGLERDGLLFRLPLGGLDVDAMGELVGHVRPDVAGDPSLVRRLHAATAGNPVMSLELLDQSELADLREGAGHRHLPQGIHDLVDTKLAATPRPGVEQLLHAAALTGSAFELGVAAGAAELELPLALDALDAALLVGLVVEVDPERAYVEGRSEYRFRHEAVRWSLASRLSGARRNHLLRRVAEATGVRELAASPR